LTFSSFDSFLPAIFLAGGAYGGAGNASNFFCPALLVSLDNINY